MKTPPAYAVLSMIYIANLVVSIIFAFLHFRQNKLLAIGLLLFLCCDIFVGLKEMMPLINVKDNLVFNFFEEIPIPLQPLFYIPSQAVLAISADKN